TIPQCHVYDFYSFYETPSPESYSLSLHDALPILMLRRALLCRSATHSTPSAPSCTSVGVSKRACVPGPSTQPGPSPPARVLTRPSGAIIRIRSFQVSAT